MRNNFFTDSQNTVVRQRAKRLKVLASACAIGALLAGIPMYGGSIGPFLIQAHAADVTHEGPVGFADLVAKVKPAVISFRVEIPSSPENMADSNSLSRLPPFARGFGTNRNPQQEITGLGSGFFISADGYAVTNNHVVDHARTVQ